MPDLPLTIGLCPDPARAGEFYVPDAKRGDLCPHGHGGQRRPLAIYARAAEGIAGAIHEGGVRKGERETVQRIVAWLENANLLAVSEEFQRAWFAAAVAIDREFGDEDKGGEPR